MCKIWYDIRMPNSCTHFYFGVLVAEAAGKTPASLGEFYLPGCLGPDLYFYDRLPPTPFVPNQKKHGNALHGLDCDTLFTALADAADGSLRPYLYGFLTHIALDSTVHPYVESAHRGGAHTRFEGVIDSVVFTEMSNDFPYRELFRRRFDPKPIDRLLARVSSALLGASVEGAYTRGVRKFRRILPLMYDSKGRLYRFLRSFERPFRKEGLLSDYLIGPGHLDPEDCMNLSRRQWVSPWEPERVRDESVPMLFEEAKALAVSLIRAYDTDDSETLYRLLHNRTMQKGLLP